MRNFLPQKRHLPGIQSLYKRLVSSEGGSGSSILERWLQNWTATPPAAPLFEGAEPPTALSWARRRGPDPPLPDAVLHKLFRNEAIRVWDPATGQIKRVKKETLLPLGAQLLFPQKAFIDEQNREIEALYDDRKNGNTRERPKFRFKSANKAPAATATATAAAALLRASVLYEDEEMVALNKPPGLAVQGGSGVKLSIDSLLPLSFLDNLKLVHRLDREVTGVLLLGKGADATARLAEAFRGKSLSALAKESMATKPRMRSNGDGVENILPRQKQVAQPTVEKVYWAVVVNPSSPLEGEETKKNINKNFSFKKGSTGYLDAPIVQGLGKNEKSTTAAAVTRYRVLQGDKTSNIAWLELEPLTGRKHQLRQHCARELGWPILGDSRYGLIRKEPQKSILKSILVDKKGDLPLFLHCRSIKIDIPGQKRGIKVVAPVPEAWKNLFSQRKWPLPSLDW